MPEVQTSQQQRDVLLIAADLVERRLLLAQLREAGCSVLPVPGLKDAVRAIAAKLVAPRLLLIDTSGDEHARLANVESLLTLVPGTPSLLVVGGISREDWGSLTARTVTLLRRPITIGEVVDAVRRALGN